MGCVLKVGPLRADFLGSTSGASFMRQVRKAADGLDAPDQGLKTALSGQPGHHLNRFRRSCPSVSSLLQTISCVLDSMLQNEVLSG
jgi:hypothetical protein